MARSELPPVEPVLGRQQDAAAGDGEPVRASGHGGRHGVQGAAQPKFSYGCAVFLDADRVNFQKEGSPRKNCSRGWPWSCRRTCGSTSSRSRAWRSSARATCCRAARNSLAAVKAQVDYIKERVPDAIVKIHPHPGEAGAIGAAVETLRVVSRRGRSMFIGLDAAIDLAYTTKNDESTTCHFCPNHCSPRSSTRKRRKDGRAGKSPGSSCEKGTVESVDALRVLEKNRKALKTRYPNLVDYEARLAFRHFYTPVSPPRAPRRRLRGSAHHVRRRSQKADPPAVPAVERRGGGTPIEDPRRHPARPQHLFVRTDLAQCFEALGIPETQVVFSDFTSEEMWAEGSRYGSIDPCYPSKVAQAHIHNLIFRKHPRSKLDFIFFPHHPCRRSSSARWIRRAVRSWPVRRR